MLYHSSNDPDLIDEFCEQIRLQSEVKTRLLFVVMTDILLQSIQKDNQIFQIKFANYLYIYSMPIFQSVQKRINLDNIKKEISNWGIYHIYADDFIIKLLNDLKTHSDCLQNDSHYAEYIKNRPSNEDINNFLILLNKNLFIRKMYEMKISNLNITELFNELIKEGELTKFLDNNTISLNEKLSTLDRVSDTFNNLKKMICRDIIKREEVIQKLSNQIPDLVEKYFYEENLKQGGNQPIIIENNNINIDNNNNLN